jgi:hypothetical protein
MPERDYIIVTRLTDRDGNTIVPPIEWKDLTYDNLCTKADKEGGKRPEAADADAKVYRQPSRPPVSRLPTAKPESKYRPSSSRPQSLAYETIEPERFTSGGRTYRTYTLGPPTGSHPSSRYRPPIERRSTQQTGFTRSREPTSKSLGTDGPGSTDSLGESGGNPTSGTWYQDRGGKWRRGVY